ncbi:MobP3 family relaxase [Congzhengia sp.]|uniref:MobP3 family relaxase n=1 Tax=Congzhengia sp. TaxID=2944168 RepID=UPI0030787CA1
MSKVIFKSPYASTGKKVGGRYVNYIAKRDRVDKSINTKKVEINLNYIATRPRVEKVGEHGLFGQDDNVNLKKVVNDIRNHNGIVWMPIISLKREDADRLGYNNADAWRNLIRSKQFEIAEAYNIPSKDLVWYGAFHDEGHPPHIHMIVYNKNPGSEYLSKKSCNDIRAMLTKTIFKDDLKQIYGEKQTLQDKIIEEVKEKINNFQIDIGGASDEFLEAFNELKFSMNGYTGKKNYQFISREQKEKVNAVVKIVCKDENLQELYRQWCRLQLANQRYYRKNPEESFDALEKNKNFERRLQNAVLKSVLRDNRNEHIYTNKADISHIYNDIIFSLCKMFEQSMQYEIEEGFTKSIVDSKEKIKEYKRNHGMGLSM